MVGRVRLNSGGDEGAPKLITRKSLRAHHLHNPLQHLNTGRRLRQHFLRDAVVLGIPRLDIGAADAVEGAAGLAGFSWPGFDEAGVEAFGHCPEFVDFVELGAVEGEC